MSSKVLDSFWNKLSSRLNERVILVLLLLSFILIVTYKLVFWALHPLNVSADQSVYLQCGELILQGKVPYRDFFDFNPPLIMYINVIPVALAHLMHWPDALGLNVTVHLFHIICVSIVGWLFYRFRQCFNPVIFVPVLLICAYYTQLLISDNGQREHIFVISFLPWFFYRGLRHFGYDPGRILGIICALIAGTCMALKPQFAFIIVVGELGFLIQAKNFRALIKPELLAILVPLIIYGICFIALPHEAIKIFFEQALTAYTYGSSWGARCSTFMMMGSYYLTEPIYQFVTALFIALVLRGKSLWLTPFTMICLAAFLNYISGGQAWTYRLLPLAFFSQMLLALEAGIVLYWLYERLKRRIQALPYWLAALVFCSTVYQCAIEIAFSIETYQASDKVDLQKLGYWGYNPRSDFDLTFFSILQNSKQGDKVIHMGSGIRPGYPCQLQANRPPGSRYLYTYLLTMLVAAREKYPSHNAEFDRLENEMLENLGSDILNNKPVLIFVQDAPIHQILDKHKFFEKYMGAYSRLGYVDSCDIYKLTGTKVNLAAITPESRANIVLAVLSRDKTVIEVSSENHLPSQVVQEWVDRAQAAIKSALTDRSADQEAQMKQEIEELNARLWAQGKEIGELNEQIARDKAARDKK
ncbi:MAG: hypothetical protein IPP57_18540 [Candidatus Obscuribacter sp.]|nr:hypothetical protein [Candidatus Obscuribacter sp.]